MPRDYRVTCNTAPDVNNPIGESISGSFSFGFYDAAKTYAAKSLQSYSVIPGGKPYNGNMYSFDAIDHEKQIGAIIWVKSV